MTVLEFGLDRHLKLNRLTETGKGCLGHFHVGRNENVRTKNRRWKIVGVKKHGLEMVFVLLKVSSNNLLGQQ